MYLKYVCVLSASCCSQEITVNISVGGRIWQKNVLSYKPVLSNHISFLIARSWADGCDATVVNKRRFYIMSLISIQRFSPCACFSFATKLKVNHCNLKFALLPEVSTHLVWVCVSVCVCLWCWSAEFKHDNPHQLSQIRALQPEPLDYITVRDTIRDGDRHRKRGKSRVRENDKAEKGRKRHGCQIVSDMAHLKIHNGNKTSNNTRK